MDLNSFIELITWRDAFDVALVAIVVYNLLLLIRGTRAVQMLTGILLLVGIYAIARAFDLLTLRTTLEVFFTLLPVGMIVIFQDEIRRGLAQFGRRSTWAMPVSSSAAEVFSEIVLACSALSRQRIGALIVIERLDGLKNYVENGIHLDARVSYDLLVNIFTPKAPLHDGAVIVQGDRVAAAACFLPLTSDPELSRDLGTRHRAAIGISEESDAVAVVVSEESGTISIAFQGRLESGLSPTDLRTLLYRRLVAEPAGIERGGPR